MYSEMSKYRTRWTIVFLSNLLIKYILKTNIYEQIHLL